LVANQISGSGKMLLPSHIAWERWHLLRRQCLYLNTGSSRRVRSIWVFYKRLNSRLRFIGSLFQDFGNSGVCQSVTFSIFWNFKSSQKLLTRSGTSEAHDSLRTRHVNDFRPLFYGLVTPGAKIVQQRVQMSASRILRQSRRQLFAMLQCGGRGIRNCQTHKKEISEGVKPPRPPQIFRFR